MEKGELPIGFDKEKVYSTYGVFFTNFTLPCFAKKSIKSSELQSIFTSRHKRKDTRKPKKKKGDEQGKMRTNLKQTQMIVNNNISLLLKLSMCWVLVY
jgi:hypothetical protein